MAAGRQDQILRFLVQAEGADALKPFLESVRDLEGASEDTRKAADALLTELESAAGLSKTLADFEKLSAAVDRTKTSYDAAKIKVDALAKGLEATQQPSKRQIEQFDQAQASLTRLGNQYAVQQAKLGQLSSTLTAAGVSTNNFAAAQAKINATAAQASQGLQQLSASAKATKTEQEALAARLADGDEAFRRQAESSRLAREALEKVRAKTRETADAQQAAAAKSGVLGAAWSKLAAIGATLVGYLSINAAIQGTKNLLGLADATEKTRIRLAALYGSAEAGNAAFAKLRELSQANGLEFANTAEAATKLKGFGIDPLNGSLQALIDQNARLGGSQETLNGIILAVGQAWAKQKLQGEEILQLVERGVPVWDLLAKATGREVVELQKLSEAGKLGRTEIAALIKEIGASAEGAAAQNLGTFGGLITQAKDQWQLFLQSIADNGVLDYAKEKLSGLIGEARRLAVDGTLTQWAKSTADGIKAAVNVVIGAAKVTYEYSGAVIALGKAYATIKVTQLTAELGLLIARKYADITATTAQTAATTASATAMGGLSAAIARIPTAVKIGIGIVGAEAAISSIGTLVDAYGQLREAQAKLNIERKDLGDIEAKLAAQIDEIKTKYGEYAQTAIKSTLELKSLSSQQADAYQAQLEGAVRYFRAIQIEAKNANDSAGFNEARQKVIEFQAELDRVRQSIRAVAAETTVVQPVINEFAAKLTEAFQTAYKEGTDAAKGIREEFGKIDVTTVQGLTDAIESIREIGKISTEAGQALQGQLRDKLKALSDEDLARVREVAEATFKAGSLQAEQFGKAIEGINLARLGVDLQQLQTGFSAAGNAAIKAFAGATDEVGKLGLTAKQQSQAIAQAFDAAFARVSSRPELEALAEQLRQAFEAGKISADDYQQRLAQLNAKLAELAGESDKAAASNRNNAAAMREAGSAADEAARGADKAAKATQGVSEAAAAAKADLGDMSQSLIDTALAMQAQATSGKQIIDIWEGITNKYNDQNRLIENRLALAERTIAANDEEARALQRLGNEFDAISEDKLKRLIEAEKKANELRQKRLEDTQKATEAEKDFANALQDTANAAGNNSTIEYNKAIRVDVRVSADASAGGQTLSQAVLDQIVAKISPVITRAVLDQIEADQSAAGF